MHTYDAHIKIGRMYAYTYYAYTTAGGPVKLGDYGRLSGSKCGALRLNAMLGNSHDFPARLPGANQYASPSAMYLEALRFIWAHKRSHREWCYGGGRDDARGICVDNSKSVACRVIVIIIIVKTVFITIPRQFAPFPLSQVLLETRGRDLRLRSRG